MISVALVSGCSTTSVNETANEIVAEARPTNVLPTNDNKQDNQTQNDSTFYEPSESLAATTSESLGIPAPEESSEPSKSPEPSRSPEPLRNPDPLPTASPIASESPSESIEEVAVVYNTVSFVDSPTQCKVPDVRTEPHSKGFPIANNDVPYLGEVNIAIVPIQFNDVKSSIPVSEYKKYLPKIKEWSSFITNNKMTYNVSMHDEWVTAPGNAKDYYCKNCGNYSSFQTIINNTSSFYDYANVDFVYILVPEEARLNYQTELYGIFRMPSGRWMRVFTWGDTPSRVWPHVIHEVLHDQGFFGHGPANGSNYGIMMGQWGRSKAVTTWFAFMASWIADSDVVCIDARDGIQEKVNIKLDSIDQLGGSPGLKTVIIRYSAYQASIIEYRTSGPFSSLFEREFGVTVYNIDTSKNPHRCDSCGPQEFEDNKNWWNYVRLPNSFDGHYNGNINFQKPGEIATINNVKIILLDKNIISVG